MADPLQSFRDSLRTLTAQAENYSELVKSVWYGLRGDWTLAHEIVQGQAGGDAAWIHAWLHRIEGDIPNARYWYRTAGREPATGDIAAEGEAIATALLASFQQGE